MEIKPKAIYGMRTEKDYVVPPITTKVKLSKLLNSMKRKIVASSKVEVEIKKELPKEL